MSLPKHYLLGETRSFFRSRWSLTIFHVSGDRIPPSFISHEVRPFVKGSHKITRSTKGTCDHHGFSPLTSHGMILPWLSTHDKLVVWWAPCFEASEKTIPFRSRSHSHQLTISQLRQDIDITWALPKKKEKMENREGFWNPGRLPNSE